jgi:FkbM family methyltransferase
VTSGMANGLPRRRLTTFGKSLNYLRVSPTSWSSARALASMYARVFFRIVRGRAAFHTVGEDLIADAPVLVRFDGIDWYVRPRSEDLAIITLNHEPGVSKWFTPRPGDFVVDVGAHIGTYALRAAKAGARVLAFEPNPSTGSILSANVMANGFAQIEVRRLALGGAKGTATIHTPPVFFGRASLARSEGNTETTTVPISRLDDEVGLASGEKVDWLKVDVEGFGRQVIQGGSETISRTTRLILEVDHGEEEEMARLLVGGQGFTRLAVIRQPTQDYWLLFHSS